MSNQTASQPPRLKQPNWLRRWLLRWQGRQQGDIIRGDVGQGARGVVIGKNVVQIGTLVIPLVPVLLALFMLIAVAGGVAWVRFVPAKMSRPGFNIAVAQFGEPGQDGKSSSSAVGRTLSQAVYTNLDEAISQVPKTDPELKPHVWHDSMFPMRIRCAFSGS